MSRLSSLLVAFICTPLYAGAPIVPKFSEEPLMASSFWSLALPILSTFATSEATGGDNTTETLEGASDFSSHEKKILRNAEEDAASYIASDGALHSARLDAAFKQLRQKIQWATQDDAQLAFALIARAY